MYRPASDLPVMFWPDDTVCWPISMYLVEAYSSYLNRPNKKGRRNRRGGTPVIKASLLSFLVRLAFDRNGFSGLSDDDILDWVSMLCDERDNKSSVMKRRKSTQVGRIVRAGLHFLIWYQRNFLENDRLIGFDIGQQITIKYKKGESWSNKRAEASKYDCLTHRYIPGNSTPVDVKPIGHAKISELYEALPLISKAKSVRKRDENILRMLEATGARRIEVVNLTVQNIKDAYIEGKIRTDTAKSDSDSPREIPIAKEWLAPVLLYINTHRKKMVRKMISDGKLKEDTGFLFLSTTTGGQLSEETITKVLSRLRKAAGITDKACAHMFRHRFITIQVATRLKGYIKQDLPMDVQHTILTKVAQLSGHSDPHSLLHYIDLAFEELNIWDTSTKVLAMRSKLEAGYRMLQTIKSDLRNADVSIEETLNTVDSILSGLLGTIQEDDILC